MVLSLDSGITKILGMYNLQIRGDYCTQVWALQRVRDTAHSRSESFNFVSKENENFLAYAAHKIDYLTRKPSVCPKLPFLSARLVGSRSEAPFICFLLTHERKCTLFAADVLLNWILLFSVILALDDKRMLDFKSFISTLTQLHRNYYHIHLAGIFFFFKDPKEYTLRLTLIHVFLLAYRYKWNF